MIDNIEAAERCIEFILNEKRYLRFSDSPTARRDLKDSIAIIKREARKEARAELLILARNRCTYHTTGLKTADFYIYIVRLISLVNELDAADQEEKT